MSDEYSGAVLKAPPELSVDEKIEKVEDLIAKGWRVGAACKEVDLTYFTYNYRRTAKKNKEKKDRKRRQMVTHETITLPSGGPDIVKIRFFMSCIEDELKKGEA